jgi:hypothetical protein
MRFADGALAGPIIVAIGVLVLSACAWPEILGHDDPQTIQHACGDGTVCPRDFECPAPFSGGPCEWHSEIRVVGDKRPDAGS